MINDVVVAVVDATSVGTIPQGGKQVHGGGIVGDVNKSEIGADYATTDANEGIRVIEEWIAAKAGEGMKHD